MQIPLLGYPTGGIYGYTHAFGGYAGSHAEYMRLVHADVNCFKVPESVADEHGAVPLRRRSHRVHGRGPRPSTKG
jgi:hypothetical protein